MDLSVIIPNYNGQDLLKKNLPKIFKAMSQHQNGEVEIIVIDDCSTDNSLAQIQNAKIESRNYNLKFKNITNTKNLGFSSTINKGISQSSGEIVILLNTDVVPEIDFLKPLLGHFQDEKIFAVGCMDKSIEGDKVVLRGRGIGKWRRGFFIHSRGEVNKTDTLWVNGGSGAFRKSIWEKLGGFNELYSPFYWEDIDLSYRGLKSGYKIVFEPKSVVVHEHEKGAIKNTYSNFRIKTIAYRNQFIFVWINITDLDLQLFHLVWLPYYFLKALVGRDLAFLNGFLSTFILIPKIIKSSFKAQKLFIKKDKEVLARFSNEK
jgi:GT2 family glycosyltransferase